MPRHEIISGNGWCSPSWFWLVFLFLHLLNGLTLALIWCSRYKGKTRHICNSLASLSFCFLIFLAKDNRAVEYRREVKGMKMGKLSHTFFCRKVTFLTTSPHAVDTDGKLWDAMGFRVTRKDKGTSRCGSSGMVALMVVYTAGCLMASSQTTQVSSFSVRFWA